MNVVQTVGHTQIRRIVLGDTDRRPNDKELKQMREHGPRSDGSRGDWRFDGARFIRPRFMLSTDEIASLSEVAGEYGGGYFTHMRNEGDMLLEAIDEALLDRPQGQDAGSYLSFENGRPAELGQNAAGDCPDQSGPRRRASK